MAGNRTRSKVIGAIAVLLVVSAAMVVVFSLTNQPISATNLADRLIIRPGDLNGGVDWKVERDLGPPDSLQSNQTSYQYGRFEYQGVEVHEALIVWNSSESCAADFCQWQKYADNLTQSGNFAKTENISVGENGCIARIFDNTWNLVFIRGNVTVSLMFKDYGMGLQLNNDAKFLFEFSLTVALVQDLKILDYQSSA